MHLSDFKVLTFDCYGTLIDWETGIWNALQPLIAAGGVGHSREDGMLAFAKHESAQQAETPEMIYSELLGAVHARISAEWGVPADAGSDAAFGAAIADWPAFPDTAAALQYLGQHYKLVILSNVDRGSFALSNPRMGVTFDGIYTAQDIGSYKPDPRNFRYAIEHAQSDFGAGPETILHTAQSLFHDHRPAGAAGLTSAWIRRPGAIMGHSGAQAGDTPEVAFAFDTMGDMAAAHRAESS